MFTGIVEWMGTVFSIKEMDQTETGGKGYSFVIKDCENILEDVILGDSIAVNGVCLTVTEIIDGKAVKFGISPETLRKTNFNSLKDGDKVNLERAMKAGQRFSGHFVQGHVDTTVQIMNIQQDPPNSIIFTFKVPLPHPDFDNLDYMNYLIPKGYVCLDGTSLTVISVDRTQRTFSVMLVKYTQDHVIMPLKEMGSSVNLEVDQIGKYVENVVVAMLSNDGDDGHSPSGSFRALVKSVVDRTLKEKNVI